MEDFEAALARAKHGLVIRAQNEIEGASVVVIQRACRGFQQRRASLGPHMPADRPTSGLDLTSPELVPAPGGDLTARPRA